MRSQIPKTNGRILLSGKVIVIEICVGVTVCVIGAIGRGLVFGSACPGVGVNVQRFGRLRYLIRGAMETSLVIPTWVGGVPCTPRLGCHDMLP